MLFYATLADPEVLIHSQWWLCRSSQRVSKGTLVVRRVPDEGLEVLEGCVYEF